ncbi:hypothetical protein LNQ49_22075 [Flavobacterium sp. F-65]|uniref:Uncharacterized protein n=1 Tax=Flavobacterium pisciphilum TaxID=2893755 RepID=A0ABS8MZT2_9FLAO|nr:hypothetical protein [Flavobacterium sp. F-65]MCC9074284.1 hypothetical protein [Flavobacterium sp. F-65]
MKNGKFASTSYSPKEYYMIVKNGIQTEYIESGQGLTLPWILKKVNIQEQ